MRGDRRNRQERLLARAQWWRDRRRKARGPEAEAAVAWDQVRGEIADLPADERPAAWAVVTDALDRVGCQFDTHVDTATSGPTRRGARMRAREAASLTRQEKRRA